MAEVSSLKGLRLAHLNVRSIFHKLDELQLIMENKPFDILTISETWLSDNIPTNEINIPGYKTQRKDRVGKKGGGVICYIANHLAIQRRSDLEHTNIESIWLELS
ncbi:endonuclease/exonuclease/phosphatase family protein, partial [Acinetobacter baumannii]|uniref:endonuclease/exonuclease/phosphatase family protein n=1 Tax=Acinetobacter baumannii TaxID=470 RepID=UPI00117857C6